MAYTFLKHKGFSTGKSLVEEDKMELITAILRSADERNVKIHLPEDHICVPSLKPEEKPQHISDTNIPDELYAIDIGPKTASTYKNIIETLKQFLEWTNGNI